MSKSRGIFVKPLSLVDNLQPPTDSKRMIGSDGARYTLLREVPFDRDGDFDLPAFVDRYNADLANDFGNLASRVLRCCSSTGRAGCQRRLRAESRGSTPWSPTPGTWPPTSTPAWGTSPSAPPSSASGALSPSPTSTSRSRSRGSSTRTRRRHPPLTRCYTTWPRQLRILAYAAYPFVPSAATELARASCDQTAHGGSAPVVRPWPAHNLGRDGASPPD